MQLGGNDHGIEFKEIDISPTPIKCPNNILKLHEIVYFDAGKNAVIPIVKFSSDALKLHEIVNFEAGRKCQVIPIVKFLSGALKLHEIFHSEKCNVIPEIKFQNIV